MKMGQKFVQLSDIHLQKIKLKFSIYNWEKKMKIEESKKIADLKIITPQIYYDFRGEYIRTFAEKEYTFKDKNGKNIKFVEDDISISSHNVLRGLHGDAKTWKLVQCIFGEFYYIVADMRKKSPTYMKWESFVLNDRNRKQILVPAGCVNGHYVLSEKCVFSYKQSEYYSGEGNQFTIRWDEPLLNIFWPAKNPLLSHRDGNAEFLKK